MPDDETPTPGEWSDWWGVASLIAGGCILLAFGAAGGLVLWQNDHVVSTVPDVVTLLLLALSAVALAGAVTAVLIEIRGRMRARELVQVNAQKRGLVLPTKEELEAASELLKSYGALKEAAMLGATAMVFAGIAAALVGWVVDDQGQSRVAALGEITLTATNDTCTQMTSGSLKAGRYVVVFNDGSKVRGILISGPSLVARSNVRQRGRTSITAELAKGTYSLTCQPSGPELTPITISG